MNGIKLIKHAASMVVNNLGAALRISGVIFLVQSGAHLALGVFSPASAQPTNGIFLTGLALAIYVITSVWIAVAWHRFLLTGELSDTILPRFLPNTILAYAWRSFLVTLFIIVPVIVFGIAYGIFAAASNGANNDSLSILFGLVALVIVVPLVVMLYRVSVVLPATALGKHLSFRQAWELTRGATGAVLLFILISILLGALSLFVSALLSAFPLPVMIVWNVVIGWISMMFGISLITTFYGHYVEDRDLG